MKRVYKPISNGLSSLGSITNTFRNLLRGIKKIYGGYELSQINVVGIH